MCSVFNCLVLIDLCKQTIAAYFSFRAMSGPPTSVLVIIIGVMACAPLNYSAPVVKFFLAPPLA